MDNSLALFYIIVFYAAIFGLMFHLIRHLAHKGPLRTLDSFSSDFIAMNYWINIGFYIVLGFSLATILGVMLVYTLI